MASAAERRHKRSKFTQEGFVANEKVLLIASMMSCAAASVRRKLPRSAPAPAPAVAPGSGPAPAPAPAADVAQAG